MAPTRNGNGGFRYNGRSEELDAVVEAVLAGSDRTLETAEGLPPAAYTSQAFFDLETEKIFRRDWICVGHVSQLANVGDYFTIDLFGDLLVVVRAPDRIRVLSRVCLHRWSSVVSGEGNAKEFTCPFHRWAYALDGQLLGGTYMAKAVGFDPKACRLPEIRSEIVEDLGLIFITFSDRRDSISERLEELCLRLKNFRLKELVVVERKHSDNPYNWKIMVETGMEAYHHFGTHHNSLEKVFPTRLSWCEESKSGWTICHSPMHEDIPDAKLPLFPDLRGAERRMLDLYLIYPLTRFGVYPDRVRLRLILPVAPALTKSTALYLLTPEVAERARSSNEIVAELSDKTPNTEDHAICVNQQRAAAGRFASPGRLSHLEATVWHLAEYVRARIRAN